MPFSHVRAIRSPRSRVRASVVAALTALGTLFAVAGPSSAATPSSGTVSPTTPQVSWQGPVKTAVTQDNTSCDLPGAYCDHYTLTVDVAPSYWDTNSGGVDVTISWTVPTNDFDLFVYQNDTEVDESANGAPSTSEHVFIPAASGVYDVEVVYFTVVNEGYTGQAELQSKAGGSGGAAFSSTPLSFAPSTVVAAQWLGGEPQETIERTTSYSLENATNPERMFVDWPLSSRAGTSLLNRSLDGGDSFRLIYDPKCASRNRPNCATGGGGDSEEDVNLHDGNVFFSDQEVLANEGYAYSSDHGDTFLVQDPATGQATAVDRQWLAATDSSFTNATTQTLDAFLSYHIPLAGEYIHGITSDGVVLPQATPQIPEVVQSGQSRVDNNATSPGHQYIYLPYRCLDGTCVDTVDGPNYVLPEGTPGGWQKAVVTTDTATSFPWVAIDQAGNGYLSWDTGGQVYYSSSPIHDKANDPSQGGHPGTFWSPAIKVNIPEVTSAVFPEIIGGSDGRIGLTYVGTTEYSGVPDNAPDSTIWNTYAAVITDATGSPTVSTGLVSHRPVHQGNICTAGTACATTGKDRSLLDMIDVSFNANGRLGVVFEDNYSSFQQADLSSADQSPFILWARQDGGPRVVPKPVTATRAVSRIIDGRADPRGDATWPNVQGAPNLPGLDETAASLRTNSSGKIGGAITLDDASAAAMASALAAYNANQLNEVGTTPGDRLQYVLRFSSSTEHYFMAMDYDPSLTNACHCTFYGGKLDANDQVLNPTSLAVVGAQYNPDPAYPVSGRIFGNRIEFRAPASEFGVTPTSAAFYSVTGFAMAGPHASLVTFVDPMRTVDATPPFDANI